MVPQRVGELLTDSDEDKPESPPDAPKKRRKTRRRRPAETP
jgi:hypothetical protein